MVAGYLKQTLGLGGVFAGTSAIVLGCGLLLLVGFKYFLGRDLHNQQSRIIPAQEEMAT